MNPPTLCGWTDDMCLIKAQESSVWKEIPKNEVEGHLISFANLWFGRAPNSFTKTLSIVRNVLHLTPLGISNDLLLRDVFDSAIETAKTPTAVDGEKIKLQEPLCDEFHRKDQRHVLAFHRWVDRYFDLLKIADERTSEDQPYSQEYNFVSQKLRAVLGFCALVLMRLMIKSELQLKRRFAWPLLKIFDCLFPDAGLNVLLVAPSSMFLQEASYGLSNSSMNTDATNLLYLLVFQYLKSTVLISIICYHKRDAESKKKLVKFFGHLCSA